MINDHVYHGINGHDSGTDLLEIPTMNKAYVSGLCLWDIPPKIWGSGLGEDGFADEHVPIPIWRRGEIVEFQELRELLRLGRIRENPIWMVFVYMFFCFFLICICKYCNYTYIYICIHAYIHTSIHPCIHPYIYTYIHTYIQTYIHTCIHIYTYVYMYMYMCMCVCVCFSLINDPMWLWFLSFLELNLFAHRILRWILAILNVNKSKWAFK